MFCCTLNSFKTRKSRKSEASNKTNINSIEICKAMLILCTLSPYIVAVLHWFQRMWLQLDDNWLKSSVFYDTVTLGSWQGVVQCSDSIFSLLAEINCYYWPRCKPAGDTFQTKLLAIWVICMLCVIYHIPWLPDDLCFNRMRGALSKQYACHTFTVT